MTLGHSFPSLPFPFPSFTKFENVQASGFLASQDALEMILVRHWVNFREKLTCKQKEWKKKKLKSKSKTKKWKLKLKNEEKKVKTDKSELKR